MQQVALQQQLYLQQKCLLASRVQCHTQRSSSSRASTVSGHAAAGCHRLRPVVCAAAVADVPATPLRATAVAAADTIDQTQHLQAHHADWSQHQQEQQVLLQPQQHYAQPLQHSTADWQRQPQPQHVQDVPHVPEHVPDISQHHQQHDLQQQPDQHHQQRQLGQADILLLQQQQQRQQDHQQQQQQRPGLSQSGVASELAGSSGGSSSPSSMQVAVGEAYLLRMLQCTPEKLASLCNREARLLTATQQQLQQGLGQLAGVLRVPPQQAAAAVRKYPRLLFAPPNDLIAQLSALQEALGLPRSKALRLVVQKPGLLLSSPGAISRQLRGLEESLGVKRSLVTRLAISAPIVLQENAPATTGAKVTLLQQELGMRSKQGVIALLCDNPVLLDYSVQSLSGKLQHLKQMLAAVPTRASEAAVVAAAALAAAAPAASPAAAAAAVAPEPSQQQAQQVAADDESSSRSSSAAAAGSAGGDGDGSSGVVERNLTSELRRMVLLEPTLLTRSSKGVQKKVDALSELTGLRAPQACSLVSARPSIITRSCKAVGGTWRALSIWRLPHGVKVRLIEEHPVLLRLSSRELHGRCRWLRSLMLRNGLYHHQMRSLQPSKLGALLLHLPATWPRLEYLLQSGREGAVKITQAVEMSEAHFCKRFPEYSQWKSWNNGEDKAREAPWRVELQKQQQEQQQEQQERKQRRQQSRCRAQQLRRPQAGTAAADAAAGSSVAWRQKALGGTVTVRVGKLKAQRPVRLTNHMGSGNSSSSSSSSGSSKAGRGSSSKDVEHSVNSSSGSSSVE